MLKRADGMTHHSKLCLQAHKNALEQATDLEGRAKGIWRDTLGNVADLRGSQ